MKLEGLRGKHVLYGVDISGTIEGKEEAARQIDTDNGWRDSAWDEEEYGDASVVSFDLDGIVYAALEDPSDGYRSTLETILVGVGPVFNRFPGIGVTCVMREHKDDRILDMYETETGLLVLSVGTDYTDSYYPSFVADFRPGNMAVNRVAVTP